MSCDIVGLCVFDVDLMNWLYVDYFMLFCRLQSSQIISRIHRQNRGGKTLGQVYQLGDLCILSQPMKLIIWLQRDRLVRHRLKHVGRWKYSVVSRTDISLMLGRMLDIVEYHMMLDASLMSKGSFTWILVNGSWTNVYIFLLPTIIEIWTGKYWKCCLSKLPWFTVNKSSLWI